MLFSGPKGCQILISLGNFESNSCVFQKQIAIYNGNIKI